MGWGKRNAGNGGGAVRKRGVGTRGVGWGWWDRGR